MGLETIEEKIKNWAEQLSVYFEIMDQHDTDDDFHGSEEKERLIDKINGLEKEIAKLHHENILLQSNGIKRYSPTDTDCRMMKGREGTHFSYNVQTAVDSKNKMIIVTKVTNHENDKNQLEHVVKEVRTVGLKPENVIADAGYYKMESIKKVEESGTQCFIPINKNQNILSDEKNAIKFRYLPQKDEYECSEGQRLILKIKKKLDVVRNTLMSSYESIDCGGCAKRKQCCEMCIRDSKYCFSRRRLLGFVKVRF